MHQIEELNSKVKNHETQRDMSPKMAMDLLIEGNKRFTEQDMIERDHDWHIHETKDSQHPFAIVLGCMDSRVQPSLIFDQGIGDLFITRVAGNIINRDILGSLEYACSIAGSRLILVLGHTACGAVKGAIDNVKLGNLTSTLKPIRQLIPTVEFIEGELRTSENFDFIDKVSMANINHSVEEIKKRSPVLKELYDRKEIDIVGAIYDHKSGMVTFCT